ncbi:hypothetical protein A6E15_03040 [Natrinema saccharevitans]|uniref:Uncharacterized protein n=1 Tax=Natrinema saccharevitans TaxID=301967 RepID=A0A1S8ATU3_9EURY|nr:hypothetical protein [Natrinema saccharevitans]OLZ40016.1 hypothetical protein A6E15_03040 [Natrinema saccharevitans]
MTDRPHTVSIAADDRARIPFALIAVLLLISSIAIVGVLDSRDAPEVDAERAVAIDRAESVAVSELRRSVLRATETAASAPVTSTDGASQTVEAAFDDDEPVFDQYLKLLVYREVAESFATTSQQVGHDTTAGAAMDRIDWNDSDDLSAAIDRVSLERPETGVLTVEVADVELTGNEIDGEPITERRDLTVSVATPLYQLKDRTDEFQRQLNTGFFETDEYDGLGRYTAARLFPYTWGKAYYDRLSSSQPAFDNLTPNDHTEVMVNDAIFGLQERTFGTTDPYKDRAMLQPTLCMAGDLASSAGDIETEDFLSNGSSLANESDLCNADLLDQDGELPDPPTVQEIALTMLEDNVETDVEIQAHPFADLGYMQMAAGMKMEQIEAEFNHSLKQNSKFNDFYLNSYFSDKLGNQEIAGRIGDFRQEGDGTLSEFEDTFSREYPRNSEIQGVINDIYQVGVETRERDLVRYNRLPDPLSPEDWAQNPGNWTGPFNVTYHASSSQADADVSIKIPTESNGTSFDDRDFAETDIRYENTIGVSADWKHEDENRSPHTHWNWEDDITYSANYTISGDLVSDDISVERGSRGIESPFQTDSWDEEYRSVDNFETIRTKAVREIFDLDSTTVRSQERELERALEDSSSSIIMERDFEAEIPYSADPDIDVSPRNEDELYEWALSELNHTHYEVLTSVEPHRTDLWNMVERPSPLGNVESNVRDVERESVYQNASEPYANTADLLRAEVRKRYFENTYDNIDKVSEWHDTTLGESSAILNDLLGGLLDTSNDLLGGPINFVDRMMDPETRPEDTQGSLKDSSLMENVNYQVEASPTYLSLETVNRTDVPAVRPNGGETLSIDDVNRTEHAPMGAGYLDGIGHPGFPLMPWPSLFYLQLDAYYLEIQGEYARFELRATDGEPTSATGLTYVRQDTETTIDVPSRADQDELAVGSVEPISFENELVVPIIVPSPQLLTKGSPGVGDPWRYKSSNSPQKNCSRGWNEVGAGFENSSGCISSGDLPVNS